MKSYFKRVPRPQVLRVSEKQVAAAFAKIAADWKRYLKTHGLKLPRQGSNAYYQLAILKVFECRAVDKNDVSAAIAKLKSQPPSDQQIRHLKTQYGWHVLNRGDAIYHKGEEKFVPDGCHVLVSSREPQPHSNLSRRAAVDAGAWEKLLEEYAYCCASCGTKIGEYHRYDPHFKVEKLEQGHMNPNKPLQAGNIIPQCRWCNRTARGDFVFDQQGRPTSVANKRPVQRAEPQVIAEIKNWLRGKS